MLSGIASYLFGAAEVADAAGENAENIPGVVPAQKTERDLGLETENADEDEWVLVRKLDDVSETRSVDPLRDSANSLSDSQGQYELGLLFRSGQSNRSMHIESSDSGMSTPIHVLHPSMEESWLVTPPPCFTAIGTAGYAETTSHPLENLLIEHPSMSVYGPRRPNSVDSEESSSSTSSTQAAEQRLSRASAGPARNRTVRPVVGHNNTTVECNRRALRSMQRRTRQQNQAQNSKSHLRRSNLLVQNSQGHFNHRGMKPIQQPGGRRNGFRGCN